MFKLPTKNQLLALLLIIFLNQLGELANACDVEPGDWEQVEKEIENAE